MEHKTMDEKMLSDAQLVALAKQNPESFGILMGRYQGPLFHYIRRIAQLGDDDVEDLLQEAFIKIYQNLNGYDEHLKFSSWAYRITHNHMIDHFRKLNARPKISALEDAEWDKLIRSSVDIEREVSNKDCFEKVKGCIQSLPMAYREVLILRFVEDKDYEEIMDILKKPKGSVATLIARGRNLLTTELKSQGINCL